MRQVRLSMNVLTAAVALSVLSSVLPASAQPPVDGRTITVAAPEPKRFVLALDEVELDWAGAGDGRAEMARSVAPVTGVRAIRRQGLRANLAVQAGSESEILAVCQAAEIANPGAEGRLVLYEEGAPRSDRTRNLLTREVAIIIDPDTDAGALLAQIGIEHARPVNGVPNAWVVLATDPLESLRVAEIASGIDGVRLAYPLLRKKQELR